MSGLALAEEFSADLNAVDARRLTDQIKLALDTTWQAGLRAWEGRAWIALGYKSWDEYCTKEFGTSHLRLPREERDEVIPSLRAAGMSVRAVGALTGLSKSAVQVHASSSTVQIGTVDSDSGLSIDGAADGETVGVDGRAYQKRASRSDVVVRQTRAVLLKRGGMTQEAIAHELGVGQATVSTDLAAMEELAKHHGVEVSTETVGRAFQGERTDVSVIAEHLGIEVTTVRDLARLSRSPMTTVVTTLDVVVETVVNADEWLDPIQRRAAMVVIAANVNRALVLLHRILEACDPGDITQDELIAMRELLTTLLQRVPATGGAQ